MQHHIISQSGHLSAEAIHAFIDEALGSLDVSGERLLVIVPDNTRTMPMPEVFVQLKRIFSGPAAALDFLVALGTHPPLTPAELSDLFGQVVVGGRIGEHQIMNHRWDDQGMLEEIGVIPADEMAELTGGKMRLDLPVRINRTIFSYDRVLICGPVFPHEVVGFSGGNKYFFPGIAGPEIINVTHWLGALLTSYAVIGAGYTPVRGVIDRAASFINLPKQCLALVLDHDGVFGLFFGSPETAWEGASTLSARVHIHTTGRTFQRVLAVMPEMYDDLWVGGKGMYKLEPVVVDGGELVIYAPHITRVSYTHGDILKEVGYHVCDFFQAHWETYRHYPWSVLAHATHVKGLGRYDPATDLEKPRIQVSLATGLPRALCEKINLGYRDPASIEPSAWENRQEEGILVVRRAGEQLYRVE